MAGLLDYLYNPSTYGGDPGLLSRLVPSLGTVTPSAGFQDPQAQPLAIGNYQMPRIGNPDQFQPQQALLPANAQPTQGQDPTQVQQPAQPLPPALGGGSMGGNIGASLQSFANTPGGVIPKLVGGLSTLISGQRTDPAGVAQQNLKAQYDSLVPVLGPQKAMLAVMNPAAGKLILDNVFGKDKYTPVKTKDMMGNETVGAFNANDGTYKPIPSAGGTTSTNILGDMSKTGPEYLATVPKQQAGILQGMVDGTIQPPSSFALAKPYWQTMLAAAKNLDPNFDANTWATRHKMSTDIAASGNSSMGGILSNGKSAFQHLAELSNSMADLGNTSHNFPGGSAAAAAQNFLGNKVFAGSDTAAKIKAINDNLGHFGQESTKFYSGTGGGVEERMNALKEMNPITTSSAEMAAYLGKEKGLMLDRLRQKEAQIRDTMGEAFLQKHPVFTPQLQETISHIDANIKKLNGEAPTQAAGAVQEGATATNPSTGAKIVFKGGQWVPAQ